MRKIPLCLFAFLLLSTMVFAAANQTFINAVKKSNYTLVEKMIKNGIKINEIRDSDEKCMTVGETVLILASTAGDIKMVKLLLSFKADPNVTNEGYSALRYASEQGHVEVIKLLIESGAQIDFADPDGFTALMSAAANDKTDAIKYLLDKGAKKSLVDSKKRTAYDYAKTDKAKAILQ